MKKVAVIGSGFAGMSAAAHLASKGLEVHVFEKNERFGGRAQVFEASGFVFDMGPSWYWMPDVFDRFFHRFGYSTADLFELRRLDPGFMIVFGRNDVLSVPNGTEELEELFERLQPGSAQNYRKFMAEARYKYEVSMDGLIYKPGLTLREYAQPGLALKALRLQLFSSYAAHIRKYFSHPRIIALLEFPVLFLGAMPDRIPALYSMMSYAGLELGTWYPMGGFGRVVEAFRNVAEREGAQFHASEPVQGFHFFGGRIQRIVSRTLDMEVDAVVGAADYHHIESDLLPVHLRSYDEGYWQGRVMAPSCMIFYLGVNKRLPGLHHHTLFFDEDIDQHATAIYKTREWPEKPLFYVCCPSKTDPSVAPPGHENLFLLMPIAPGLNDAPAVREDYYNRLITRLEKYIGTSIREHIVYKRSFCVSDFKSTYNAFLGNAYGLANTLGQTAMLKPRMRSKKVSNLFYAGQLTVPGPGVPPAIISGEIAAKQLLKHIKHECKMAL